MSDYLRVWVFKSDYKQSPFELGGLLAAFGRCKDMRHIRVLIDAIVPLPDGSKVMWSSNDFVQMIQTVQEGGAADLLSFELQVDVQDRSGGCRARRVGWLDVPSQPKFKGEWRVDALGSILEDADMIISSKSA